MLQEKNFFIWICPDTHKTHMDKTSMVPLFTELYWWSVGYSKSCEIRTPLG
jgi:hypothetical protein